MQPIACLRCTRQRIRKLVKCDWLPGDLVVVLDGTLVSRLSSSEDSSEEQFTKGLKTALVICRSHRWEEPNELQEESHMYYTIFFSDDNLRGFYVVQGSRLLHPDEVNNPARLFGSQRLSG